MRFNVVSNLSNGVGLQQDFLLLKQELEKRGHSVKGVQFNARPLIAYPADVNIFLEVVTPEMFKLAPKQWVVPNPEWWFAGWESHKWDLVLAKTRDCETIFRDKMGRNKCRYIGWMSRDLYNPEIKRDRKFLHIAGKSRFKNSQAVIAGCRKAKVSLTVVGEHTDTVQRRVTDCELIHLMNSHFCHVMPSAYEGYGQVLHEAQGVGQVIITTNAAPMNELSPAILIPSMGTRAHHAGLLHSVSPESVAEAVKLVMNMPDNIVNRFSEEARVQYKVDREQFLKELDALVGRA